MLNSTRILILASTLAICSGCGSSAWERTATASSVGCNPEQVKVVSKDSGAFDNIQSWYADCRGTRYRCVFIPGDKGGCYPISNKAN